VPRPKIPSVVFVDIVLFGDPVSKYCGVKAKSEA
jgi:hypothetical protein